MNWITRHIQTITTLSGITEEEARRMFGQPIHVSIDDRLIRNPTYRLAYACTINLLSRTFPNTAFNPVPTLTLPFLPSADYRPERKSSVLSIHFGRAPQRTGAIVANMHNWHVITDDYAADPGEPWNPFLALFSACTTAARAAARLFGTAVHASGSWPAFSILDWRSGTVTYDWNQNVDLGRIHLAGVGAVGTAALYAILSHSRVRGEITLLDHEAIDEDNIGRYILFTTEDVGHPKVDVAARWVRTMLPSLHAAAYPQRLQQYLNARCEETPNFRIEQLLSAPDRRDTRRSFQQCLPKAVWDASTGPDHVVVHHNKFIQDEACMACVYHQTPDEDAGFRHIAEKLNVSIDRVKSGDPIDREDALRIHEIYAHLAVDRLIGKAFDSIFRDLCGAGQLRVEGRQMLAPLPFISAMAGFHLAFEFFKSRVPEVFARFQDCNYAQLNPFFPPNPALREWRRPRPNCFCQLPQTRRIFDQLWKA